MPTSGLPTARHHFPPGTDRRDCIDWNRTLKVARIAAKALEAGYDDTLSDEQMDSLARDIDVNAPGSEETRAAVRAALEAPLTYSNTDTDFANAVTGTAHHGHPFRYRDGRGRTVLLIALPVDN